MQQQVTSHTQLHASPAVLWQCCIQQQTLCNAVQGSVPRPQAPASDLFIPDHTPFDRAASQQQLDSPLGLARFTESSFRFLACDSNAVAELGWQGPQLEAESDLTARHPFKLLPTAVFEHLADPNLLTACKGSSLRQKLGSTMAEVSAQQTDVTGARHADENGIQSRLCSMQQKPVWEPVSPGCVCCCNFSSHSRVPASASSEM